MTDRFVLPGGSAAETSTGLLDRVRHSDPLAWNRLVDVYTPLIYWWCRRSQLQAADAVDVGQEVFVAVARKIGDFRRDQPGNSFRKWLKTITRTKIADFYRQHSQIGYAEGGTDALLRMSEFPAVEEVEENAADAENERFILVRAAVQSIRHEFEEKTWQAFWDLTIEQLSAQSVADKLGISRNAVYLAKSHVKRRLKAEFADMLDYSSTEEVKEP